MATIYLATFHNLADAAMGSAPMVRTPGIASSSHTIPTNSAHVKVIISNYAEIIRVVADESCEIYFKGWEKGGSDTDASARISVDFHMIANAVEYISIPPAIELPGGTMPWYNRGIFIRKST